MGSRRPLSKLMCPAEPIKPKWTRHLYYVLHKCTVFLPRFLYEAIHAILYVHFGVHFIVFAKLTRYHHKLYFWYIHIELHEWPTKRNLSKRKYCSGIWKLLHTSRKPSGESSLKEKARGRWRRKRRRVWKAHFRDLPFADKRGEDIYTAIKRVMPIFHLILENVSTIPQKICTTLVSKFYENRGTLK